jgi:phenylacetate-CoA ligase
MTDYFDALETRSADARAAANAEALARQVAHAKARTRYFAASLADVDPATIDGPDALARLPVLRKSRLVALQAEDPPFGGLLAVDPAELAGIHLSPGPICDPAGREPDFWRFARALHAAGVRAGDIVHNAFAYHLTPAGAMFEAAARALGCPVIPAGVGNTEQQAAALAHARATTYAGTPDFLKVLLDAAAELGLDAGSLAKAVVSGGALFPKMREDYAARGVAVLQCYGTADLGLVAYESEAAEGMIVDEGVIVEIVRPGTGDPVPSGEVGEVVVTTFNPVYPLIRFATGDLSAVLPGPSPCGRTNMRIKGWMGRADQTTKVKGMFVRPEQIAEVAKRHPEIRRARLVVGRDGDADVMALHCEAERRDEALADAVAASLQAVLKLRGQVVLAGPGALPNDGKVIDDTRQYET